MSMPRVLLALLVLAFCCGSYVTAGSAEPFFGNFTNILRIPTDGGIPDVMWKCTEGDNVQVRNNCSTSWRECNETERAFCDTLKEACKEDKSKNEEEDEEEDDDDDEWVKSLVCDDDKTATPSTRKEAKQQNAGNSPEPPASSQKPQVPKQPPTFSEEPQVLNELKEGTGPSTRPSAHNADSSYITVQLRALSLVLLIALATTAVYWGVV